MHYSSSKQTDTVGFKSYFSVSSKAVGQKSESEI